jgi:tryptophanyl-tRNA synthetase
MKKEVVLSGIRATGRLHLGNFVGAVRHFVQFQQSGNHLCMYFVADQHTLTTLKDPKALQPNLIEMVKDYLAAGLDPEKSILYTQSSVPEITELCLYLGMVQPLGELQNIPTFKDLVRKNPENVSHGLITYPVLMAADILGPRATIIPVGEDQVPNVELARGIARRFNNRFGPTFEEPRMLTEMAKIPGLDGEKMGKSEANNAVDINSDMPTIRERYLKFGITDIGRRLRSDPGNPFECKSIYPMHEILTPSECDTMAIAKQCQKAEIGCVECKNRMVDSLAAILQPFHERRKEMAEKTDDVVEILHEGGKKARAIIAPTVAEVREKMGIHIY